MDANGTTLTLKIGKAGATLAQVTASGVSAFYTITVCFDQGVLTAAGAGMSVFAASAEVASGTYAGLAGVLGGERFRNFRFEKHRSFSDPADRDCEHCEELVVCDGCKDSQAPAYWLVEVSGFGNGTCSECTRAEEVTTGSFLLFNAGVFNPCGWEMFTLQGSDYYICCHGTMPTSCSGTSPCGFESWFAFADISLQITRNYNGTGKTRALCTLGFGASFGSCSQTVEYEKLVPDDTLDCMDANGIELDLSTINVPSCGSAPNDLIDASASRVRIYPA
jgi:hypothetical protein